MKNLYIGLLAIALALFSTSCSDDDDNDNKESRTDTPFSVLGVIDKAYYLAQTEKLNEGSLSFVNNGTQLDADQAARIISTGKYLYSLNYGTGALTQLMPNETGGYDMVKEVNAGLSVGTNRPRFKLADENTIMVYNVTTETVKHETIADSIVDMTCTLRLSAISIPSLTIGNSAEFVIPQSQNAKKGATIGYHPSRVDGPVISDNKIYFGLMHTDIFDPTVPPPFRKPKQTGLESLVFDYPSFSNGKVIESDAASGHTSGYRAPSMHVDEKGDVYQSNWFLKGNSFDLSDGDKTVITRLKGGDYDDSYVFNVSESIGLNTNIGTVGWFYVGNGIGYMPIHLEDEGKYVGENSWAVAKIDIYNKTAIKLDVPLSGLFSYENGVVADGKFYMAISPLGDNAEAFVYEFDPTSDETTGFKKGLKLDGGNVIVDGVY